MDEVRRLLNDHGIPSEKNDCKQKGQCSKSIPGQKPPTMEHDWLKNKGGNIKY